jgi:hypothetical protein
MKVFIGLLIFILLIPSGFAQKNSARSKAGALVITKKTENQVATPPGNSNFVSGTTPESDKTGSTGSENNPLEYQTPFLMAEVTYTDPNDNNYLDAGEVWIIHVKLTNTGKMTAEQCNVQIVQETFNPGVVITPTPRIPLIGKGETVVADVKMKAMMDVRTGKTPFKIAVIEKRGFDLEPEVRLTVPTREFQPPILEFTDYVIQDQNRNSRIEKREVVDIIFRIQNKGESTAYGCKAEVKLGTNVLTVEVPPEYLLGDIKSGEYKDITASIVTNSRTTEVTMTVAVSENSGRFGRQKFFTLPFDVVQKKPEELAIATRVTAPVKNPDMSDFKLDIAENIPAATVARKNGIAVIIGNKDYDMAPDVDYALNDARIMKNYAGQALGFRDANILLKENTRQSDLYSLFGNETNYKGQLYNYTVYGQSELFIYYSGHGAPDPNTSQGYLVPVDCDPNSVALNGYPLQLLIGNLQKVIEDKQVKQVTVILEACFSGSSENGSLLKNVSPVSIRLKDQDVTSEKMTVFTSCTGDQLSNWYPEMRQSLYTYFFLKGLKGEADINKDHRITANELHQYVADEVNGVPYWAKRLHNGRNQTPTMKGRGDIEIFK